MPGVGVGGGVGNSRLLFTLLHSNLVMINKINHPSKYIKSKYKIALVGPYGAGKTCLLSRFISGAFSEDYHMTLKLASQSKSVQLEECLFVKLQLLDTLGNGLSAQHFHSSFRDIDAVLLVYDVTNEQSFHKLNDILQELKTHIQRDTLYGLVGSHCEEPYLREVTLQEGMKFKKRNGISLFYEVSAKTNENVPELFHDLAKYLIIVNSYKEKEENPEISTTFSEERLGARANSSILEKKLAYKEEECKNLWKDYELALEKIDHLESRAKDESSYILNYMGESEDLEQRIRYLEQELQNVQQDAKERYDLREEEYTFTLHSLRVKAEERHQENMKLQSQLERHSKELVLIESIIHEHEQNSKMIIERKDHEIHDILSSKEKLIEEKRVLNDLIEEEIRQRAELKLNSERTERVLRKEIEELERTRSQLQAEVKQLSFLRQESNRLIEQYERSLTFYREEMVEKQYIEEELDLEKEKYISMELTYEENLQQVRSDYENLLDSMRKEKEAILEAKEKVVNKLIEVKVNEIRHIRSFIDDMDTKKESNEPCKTDRSHRASEPAEEEKTNHFFDQFLERIKQNSQYLQYNLQTLAASYEDIESSYSTLIEDVEKMDLSEVWYDLREGEGSSLVSIALKAEAYELWHIFNIEAQKRISKCVGGIQQMAERLSEANSELRENVSHIAESLEKIEKISELGIQSYIESVAS